MAWFLCALLVKQGQLMEEQSELLEYEGEDRTVCGCKILALTLAILF